MQFKINSKGKTVQLSVEQVLDSLFAKYLSLKDTKSFEKISSSYLKFLQFNDVLESAPLGETIKIAFILGYYYRVFLEKNEVEIEFESANEESIDTNGNS